MGRTSKDRGRRELDGPTEGLGHNPFTQLTGGKGKSGLRDQDASLEQPPQPPSKTPAAKPDLIVRRERKGRGGKGSTPVQPQFPQPQSLQSHPLQAKPCTA